MNIFGRLLMAFMLHKVLNKEFSSGKPSTDKMTLKLDEEQIKKEKINVEENKNVCLLPQNLTLQSNIQWKSCPSNIINLNESCYIACKESHVAIGSFNNGDFHSMAKTTCFLKNGTLQLSHPVKCIIKTDLCLLNHLKGYENILQTNCSKWLLHGKSCNYLCEDSFVINNKSDVFGEISCNKIKNETIFNKPVCKKLCKAIEIPHGKYLGSCENPIEGMNCTLSCNKFYEAIDTDNIIYNFKTMNVTCLKSGWSRKIGCKKSLSI